MRLKSPTLLMQFSIISLALFIAIGAILGWGLTQHLERQALDQQEYILRDLVSPTVSDHLTERVIREGAPAWPQRSQEYRTIENALSLLSGSGLVRVKIWNDEGMIIYSDEPRLVGGRHEVVGHLKEAFEGDTIAEISELSKAENAEERGYGELLEIYTPIWGPGGGKAKAVFEGYYAIDDLRQTINATSEFLWMSIITGFLFLYVSLFTIVRNASQRLLSQSRENAILLSDTRRKADRLAVVNELARSINSSSLNLDEVFDTALRGVDRIVDHAGASIALFDSQTGEASDIAVIHLPSGGIETVNAHEDVEVKKRLLGSTDMFLCGDTRVTNSPELLSLASSGVLSLLVVAIRLGDRRLGVFCLVSDSPNAFSQDDAGIIKGVADQLAVAIENTRLIRETAETTALRETNRLKDEFASMVSHELRTPLASIKGYSRTLLAPDAEWDEETRHEFLSIISDESDKLAELVENLLETSRIEARRFPITPEPILLKRFCAEVVERVGCHYPEMKFECNLADDLPMAMADARRVEQVLTNLLQNAAKYSGAEIVWVEGSYEGGDEVILRVEDNGVGIAPEHLPHLFEKFYRVETASGNRSGGTGLGLAIAKVLIESQGGRMWVESEPGKGTSFFFTLPVFTMDDAVEEMDGKGSLPSGTMPTTSEENSEQAYPVSSSTRT
jgi:signal transduction histidine kinase